MVKKEIEKKLEKLNREEFSIQMKDRWSDADFERMREINEEQIRLKKLLNQGERE